MTNSDDRSGQVTRERAACDIARAVLSTWNEYLVNENIITELTQTSKNPLNSTSMAVVGPLSFVALKPESANECVKLAFALELVSPETTTVSLMHSIGPWEHSRMHAVKSWPIERFNESSADEQIRAIIKMAHPYLAI